MEAAFDNPMGTDGFEFVEYTAPDPAALADLFERMGFAATARHRSKNVTLYQQGDVNFILDLEPASFAQSFAHVHGPSVCAFALRVALQAAGFVLDGRAPEKVSYKLEGKLDGPVFGSTRFQSTGELALPGARP